MYGAAMGWTTWAGAKRQVATAIVLQYGTMQGSTYDTLILGCIRKDSTVSETAA